MHATDAYQVIAKAYKKKVKSEDYDHLFIEHFLANFKKGHKMRVLPSGWRTPASFTMHQDKVGIHLGNNETMLSIVIQNKDIVLSFRTTFDVL